MVDEQAWVENIFMSSVEMDAIRVGLDAALRLDSCLFVEVGVGLGKTSLNICRYLEVHKPGFYYLGIDYVLDSVVPWRSTMDEYVSRGNAALLLVNSMVSKPYLHFSPAFVFIDGCHCVDCVYNDIATWFPLLVPGGILVFHDTSPAHQGEHQPTHVPHGMNYKTMGTVEAIEKFELASKAELVHKIDDMYGVSVYRK